MAWKLKRPARTGWYELPLLNGWTGRVLMKRVRDTIWIRAEGLNGTAATDQTAFNVPAGYQPEGPHAPRGTFHTASALGSPPSRRWYYSTGRVIITDGTTAGPLYGEVPWDTIDAWPTIEPGVKLT